MSLNHLLAGIQECQKVDEGEDFEDACSFLKEIPRLAFDVVLLKSEERVSLRSRSLKRLTAVVMNSGRFPDVSTSGNSPHPCSVTMPFTLSMTY